MGDPRNLSQVALDITNTLEVGDAVSTKVGNAIVNVLDAARKPIEQANEERTVDLVKASVLSKILQLPDVAPLKLQEKQIAAVKNLIDRQLSNTYQAVNNVKEAKFEQINAQKQNAVKDTSPKFGRK